MSLLGSAGDTALRNLTQKEPHVVEQHTAPSQESMPPIWWSPTNDAVAYTEWAGRIHEMEVNDGHVVPLPTDAIRLSPMGEVEQGLRGRLARSQDREGHAAIALERQDAELGRLSIRVGELERENKQLRAENKEYRKRVTMGGPTVPVDTTWANVDLPAPESASDPSAPPLVTGRGSNRQ